ncbi:MAG: prephenate dehydratase [Rikenellaceae bacterium]
MEDKLKVAIQGFKGCFHQEAAYALLGEDITTVGCSNFRELARRVIEKEADMGLMAIENSIAGSILPNYALLQDGLLKITGEIHMRIRQNLLGIKGAQISEIVEVQSHPMALLQSMNFLDTIEGVRLVESRDTAYSAEQVAKLGDKTHAAIGSCMAAEIFGLEVLKADIHTVENNYTRFILIERDEDAMPVIGANKASLFFKITNERGSLATVLRCFETLNVNMTKLQSYPIPADPFNYIFHTDMEFDHMEEFLGALQRAQKVAEQLDIIGIYKKGEFI